MRLEAGKKSRKFSFVNFAAYIVNVAIVFATIMAYLSTVTNPSVFTFPAFFGLIFPLLALANLLFVIWWMIKRKKAFLLSFFTLILVSGLLGRTFVKNKKCNVQTPDFSVLSYNTRLFNVYFWHDSLYTDAKIREIVHLTHASVVCFQEFLSNNRIKSFEKFRECYPYYYASYEKGNIKFNLLTFSKYPILNSGNLTDGNHTFASYTDIKIKTDTVRFFNVHLKSVSLADKDYGLLDSLKFSNGRFSAVLKKLSTGYSARPREVSLLKSAIKKSPYPVILCGDFNDVPASYVYTEIASELTDAFVSCGKGLGNTYVFYLPLLRIDYIFYQSSEFDCVNFQKIICNYSDHYPILSKFKFKN